MFSRILIANRGEIACRIIATCHRLGIGTVAVFSDADRDARHVKLADRAVWIGGSAPAASYLDGARIIAAAVETGAEAIHPGYGFLSENPDFVDAVAAAGLTFIGPSAAAIRAMGLKDAAKRAMEAAGVPVVPGYHGEDQEPGRLEVEADRIGYPVLIKAVAGGGGKGMRRVDDPERFMDALEAAKAEALGAFGSDAVLIEKFVTKPRHVEVQIFGDGTRAVHLFERDCSCQRRHQKVLEEAPAPAMTDAVREAMGAAAIRAATAIGYAGAGTVEFIADGSDGLHPDKFWFMEMNTRLQVEHPVTEAITGVDLVEWQLRVAAGQGLPPEADDLRIAGHAVEVRLYAEDVPAGFLPATGQIDHLAFPLDIRTDTGVAAGDRITPHYDPMIAKLIAHGSSRSEAFARLARALDRTEIAGLTTNHGFLRKLVGHPRLRSGDVDTALITDNPELAQAPVPCSRSRALAALGVLGLDRPAGALNGFAIWDPLSWEARFSWDNQPVEARVTVLGPARFEVSVSDHAHEVVAQEGNWWIDGVSVPARILRRPGHVSVFWGNGYHFQIPDPLSKTDNDGPVGDAVLAPMPGLVRRIHVRPGDAVEGGDALAILEAMKMEHTLVAPRSGVVAEVLAEPGAQVDAGAALVRLEASE
ncbi:MAG: biotin carboxylase N-terminal domain-containing protein [Pseudomonadota bacterium]